MNLLAVGFILGWLGCVYSYHLAPPVNPGRPTTTTLKPTTTTNPVEYEAPEIEGPVSTTTTVATTTTTTKKPTTHGYGHGQHGGYYDQYGQYHYDPYHNAHHNDPYGAYHRRHDPYGRHISRAPYPPHAPHPNQAPYGSRGQGSYTDPYAPQYDQRRGGYSDPYHNQNLKPRGQSALMDQLSIVKPSPSPPPTPYRRSGKWIEMRPATELRMKSRRRNGKDSQRRRGYIPRGEQQPLRRRQSGSNYYQGNAGARQQTGGSQSNWQNNQQQPRRPQHKRRGGQQNANGKQGRWNNNNSWNYQQSRDSTNNAGGVRQSSTGNSGSAYQNTNYNTNSAYSNQNSVVQPSPYPSVASGQNGNTNYYPQGYSQGQGTGTSNGYNQQEYNNYNSAGASGNYNTQAPGNYASNYNNQATYNYGSTAAPSQQQTYNNNPTYNYDTSYNNQVMENYDANGNQLQSAAYNTAGSWDGQNNNMNYQTNWNAGNSFGQGQPSNTVTDKISGYMNMNSGNTALASNTGSSNSGTASLTSDNSNKATERNVAETMMKVLEKIKTAAAANASSSNNVQPQTPSNSTKQDSIISKSMEAAIKNAIINAAKDLSKTMKAKETPTYVATQETYQMPPAVQALDTSFKADVTSSYGWTQPPSTTVQTWTQAPPTTTAAPAAASGQWGSTGGLWGSSALDNFYQVTIPPRGSPGGPWATAAPTTPKMAFLGEMSRRRQQAALASTVKPRTTPNPMRGFQQVLLASLLFNKK